MNAVTLKVTVSIIDQENYRAPVAIVEREVTRRFGTAAEALQFLGEMNREASQELEDATKMSAELDSSKDDSSRLFGGKL